MGTSVPELVTSVIAALKKQTDMAVGNIIGSNIFNIFWIAGISAVVRPIPVDSTINLDLFLLATATLFFFTGIYSHKEHTL
ncbi:MAG: hypothetical protein H6765_09745 [Candidatus Peribacteria bacterium]|nr:MAG: hypothetical protein H6765_09745 [Candidatus Peribacteria bacterium]